MRINATADDCEIQSRLACENYTEDDIQAWKQRAHESDIHRGTKLGLLGYLPAEIRLEIWKLLFKFKIRIGPPMEEWENITSMHQHPVEHDLALREPHIFWYLEGSGGTHGTRNYQLQARRVRNLGQTFPRREARWDVALENIDAVRQLSPTIRSEIDHVFFSMHQLSFDDPYDLFMFWDQLSHANRNRLRHLALWIGMPTWIQQNTAIHERRLRYSNCRNAKESSCTPSYLYCRPRGRYLPHGDEELEEWVNAITCLPSTLKSVVIHVGGVEEKEQQELRILYFIAKTIKEVAAEAVVTVSHSTGPHMGNWFFDDERLADKKFAELEAVVEEAARSNTTG